MLNPLRHPGAPRGLHFHLALGPTNSVTAKSPPGHVPPPAPHPTSSHKTLPSTPPHTSLLQNEIQPPLWAHRPHQSGPQIFAALAALVHSAPVTVSTFPSQCPPTGCSLAWNVAACSEGPSWPSSYSDCPLPWSSAPQHSQRKLASSLFTCSWSVSPTHTLALRMSTGEQAHLKHVSLSHQSPVAVAPHSQDLAWPEQRSLDNCSLRTDLA